MLYRKSIKHFIVLVSASFALLNTATISHAQLSKTPNLNKEVNFTPVEEVLMPEGYPGELNELTEDIRSYVVIDQETNKILMARQANTVYPIASMSKVPAVFMVYKAIEEGRLQLEDKIKISPEIVEHLTHNPELSSAGLVADVEYSVKDFNLCNYDGIGK